MASEVAASANEVWGGYPTKGPPARGRGSPDFDRVPLPPAIRKEEGRGSEQAGKRADGQPQPEAKVVLAKWRIWCGKLTERGDGDALRESWPFGMQVRGAPLSDSKHTQ